MRKWILVLVLFSVSQGYLQNLWAKCGQKDQINYSGTSFENNGKSRIKLEASNDARYSQVIRFDESSLAYVYDYKLKCWKLTNDTKENCANDGQAMAIPNAKELANPASSKISNWGKAGVETASLTARNSGVNPDGSTRDPELIINSVNSDASIATNMTYLKFQPTQNKEDGSNKMSVTAIHAGSTIGEYNATSYFDNVKRDDKTKCQKIDLIGNDYESILCGECKVTKFQSDNSATPLSNAK